MNNPRVGVATVVRYGNYILLGLRKSELGKNTWGLPGGKLDFGEDIKDCAVRELKEETNLTAKPENLKLLGVSSAIFDNETHYITIIFDVLSSDGMIKIMEPDKCEKWQWFETDKLPENLFLPLKNFKDQIK